MDGGLREAAISIWTHLNLCVTLATTYTHCKNVWKYICVYGRDLKRFYILHQWELGRECRGEVWSRAIIPKTTLDLPGHLECTAVTGRDTVQGAWATGKRASWSRVFSTCFRPGNVFLEGFSSFIPLSLQGVCRRKRHIQTPKKTASPRNPSQAQRCVCVC